MCERIHDCAIGHIIGYIDQSKPLPSGGTIELAEGVVWMAFYCTVMLDIAVELACHNSTYVGVASKFLDHFVAIYDAMERIGEKEDGGLWSEADGLYYNHIRLATKPC